MKNFNLNLNYLQAKFFTPSSYIRNILTLMMGTILAQLMPILIMPLLSRIYTPEQFGFLGFYTGSIAIGVVLATGKFEAASILPYKDSDALHLLALSFIFTLILTFICLLASLIFFHSSPWFYFVPIGVFFSSSYILFLAWLTRKKRYKEISNSRIIQSGLLSAFQIIIGLGFSWSFGLIIADILGKFFLILYLIKNNNKEFLKIPLNKIKLLALLKRYKNFLKFSLSASLVNNLSFQLPYLIIPLIFSKTIAGFYFLVFRALMLPISVVGLAILDAFRVQALDNLRKYGECRTIFIKTLLLIFIIGFLPTLIILIWGKELFVFVFGLEWEQAGKYAQIIAPMALLRFISSPLSYVFILREKLFLDLALQSLFLIMVCCALALGQLYLNATLLVALLSVSASLFYLIQIGISWQLSGKYI